jgi:outer membrane protein assembly factor BamB
VEGDALYALGSDGDLVCASKSEGKVRWKKNLRADFGGKPGKWAYSESPLVDGDSVVCTPGGEQATLVALNKKTGDVIWKSAVPGGDQAAYSSIIIVNAGGVKQYIQFLEKGLVGVEAKSGKFLWRYDKTAQGSPANIPTPIAHDGYIYSATGRGGGGLIKLKSTDGKFEPEQIYFTPKLPTAIGGGVLLDQHLYGTTGQGMLCAEFTTGNVKWQERSIGAGSLCAAEGLLYLHGENGDMALIEATPDSYREKGRFTPPDQPERGRSKAWAYPVLANGKLYIRDHTALWCYDVRDGRTGR